MAIAQKCNYTMRCSIRQRTTLSVSPEHQTDSMCQDVMEPLPNITEPPLLEAGLADELKPFCVQTLESIMIFITMVASEKCTICRMVDFVMQDSSGNVTIESLAFNRFISILKEDIQFDLAKHSIFYRCTKGMVVAITNEQSWKAAIRDMYTGGMDSFDFHVKEKGKYMIAYSLAYF